MSGKGSQQRPTDMEKFRKNYDNIDWGRPKKPKHKAISMFDLPDETDWLTEIENAK